MTLKRKSTDNSASSNYKKHKMENNADYEQLDEWIKSKCTIVDDHWIANGSSSQIFSHPKLRLKLSIKVWVYLLRHKLPLTADLTRYNMHNTCKNVKCVFHTEKRLRELKSFNECEAEDYLEILNRFTKYVAEPDAKTGCINWKGGIQIGGYGMFAMLNKTMQAHRVSWMLANFKEIPDALIIRHKCPKKNRLCVNPEHLETGTHKDNAQDEKDMGFKSHGENVYQATITNEQARQICDSRKDGKSQKDRAKQFGVSINVIRLIDTGKTWQHVLTEEQKQKISKRKRIRHLSRATLREIYRYRNSSNTQKSIAQKFGLSQAHVKRIYDNPNIYSDTDEDEENRHARRVKNLCKSFKTRLQEKITKYTDSAGEHWLYNNDMSQKFYKRKESYYELNFGKKIDVHRGSYMAHNNILNLPNDVIVRHICKFKHCVQPDHLELGSHADNAKDKIRDNTAVGMKSKISEETAKKIIASQHSGLTKRQRAEQVGNGATESIVRSIDRGRSWSKLPRPKPENANSIH